MASSSILETEGVVVISCDNLPAENIINHILGKDSSTPAICYSNIRRYLWNLETKYYTAEVYLYTLELQEKLDNELSETVKAIIFYIDNTEDDKFENVKNWMSYLENIEAEVQLLICNKSNKDSEGRKNILNWCVQNQFELVELNASEEIEEEECSIKDVLGYERVIQSLQSHQWANLRMKDERSKAKEMKDEEKVSPETEVGATGSSEDVTKTESEKNSKKVKVGNEELELEEQWVSNVINGEDPGGESFEALFAKFASMKDRAADLNGEDRKKYAEKVAIAFWRAMGGDEDEIEGLDDDD